jgi:hypothetical protein
LTGLDSKCMGLPRVRKVPKRIEARNTPLLIGTLGRPAPTGKPWAQHRPSQSIEPHRCAESAPKERRASSDKQYEPQGVSPGSRAGDALRVPCRGKTGRLAALTVAIPGADAVQQHPVFFG